MQSSRCGVTSVRRRGRISSLQTYQWYSAQFAAGHISSRNTWLTHIQLVHHNPQLLFYKALLYPVSSQSVPLEGLCQPNCRTLHLPLLNFVRSPRAHFSSLTRSVWVAALPSSVSATPPNLVSPINVLRGHSIPSSWSLHQPFQESKLM